MVYFSTLKRKDILTYITTWLNLEDIMFPELITKGQVLHDSTYLGTTVVKFIETERMVVARGCGDGGMGELLLNRYRVLACKMKRILWMDGGDDSTTMWMYLMPLNCTLKNRF